MAGLTRSLNIVTSKNRAFPNFPRAYMPSESWPYYGSHMYTYGANVMLPGFLNFGSVGSSISVNSSGSTNALKMYNGQGTEQTAGSWNSGFAPGDGAAAYDTWSAFYMDRVDNLLYVMVIDTSTDPDTYRMMTIDKDGTVAFVTAAYQVTNTGLENMKLSFDTTPPLYRVGGVDGTGNFRMDRYRANTPNDNATQPYDGVRLEINTSSGTVNSIAANTMVETTDGLIPNNIFIGNSSMGEIATFMGPTDNGIIGAPSYGDYRYNAGRPYGLLGNATTGQLIQNISFGMDIPFYYWSDADIKPVPWLGSYFFHPIGGGYVSGINNFSRADAHAYLDELAVWYGLL
jgi:hypothetical protein